MCVSLDFGSAFGAHHLLEQAALESPSLMYQSLGKRFAKKHWPSWTRKMSEESGDCVHGNERGRCEFVAFTGFRAHVDMEMSSSSSDESVILIVSALEDRHTLFDLIYAVQHPLRNPPEKPKPKPNPKRKQKRRSMVDVSDYRRHRKRHQKRVLCICGQPNDPTRAMVG